MSEDLSEFLEHWRADYESGNLAAGYEAALFCIAYGQAIPVWLAPMARQAVERDFLTSEGRGRGGTPANKSSRKWSLRNFILAEVDRLNSRGIPKATAFEKVAKDLSNHERKLWTGEMVKAEYYRNR